MSIKARLDDAVVLYENGRKEGALLLILVAVAATSRKRYPEITPSRLYTNQTMKDKEAFTLFLKDEMPKILGLAGIGGDMMFWYRGTDPQIVKNCRKRSDGPSPPGVPPGTELLMITLQDILYLCMRCSLVHQARLSSDLVLAPHDSESRGWKTGFTDDGRFLIEDHIIDRLYWTVVEASENADVFTRDDAFPLGGKSCSQ